MKYQWHGSWRYTGLLMYGQEGTEIVMADTEEDAKRAIKFKAARDLGVPGYSGSIQVTHLKKQK